MRNHHRRHRGGGAMRALCASRHEKGVTYRTSRGSRHYATARGVHHADAPVRPPRLAGERPHRGRSRRGRVVPADLPHRAEDSARMVEMKLSAVSRQLSALLLLFAGPLAGQTSLSIYTDGRVVVRRTLAQALEKGRNALTLQLEDLDPATLFSPDTSAAVVSAVVRAPTDREAALRHAVGQTLAFVAERADGRRDTVRASVVRVAPPQYRLSDGRFLLAEPAPAPAEQAVGETHVYQLSGRLSVEPGTPVTTALFPRTGVPFTQELIVPGALPWRGFPGQSAAEPNRVPVQVWYTLKRARGSAFGDRPLPAGTVQLYQTDSAGRVQLVGEARSDHTAPGRDLRVQSGEAFDVTAERVQTDYNQEQIPPPKRGLAARQRITAAYRVTISNAKPEAVTVDVRESHYGT